jgi:hypothetical protein
MPLRRHPRPPPAHDVRIQHCGQWYVLTQIPWDCPCCGVRCFAELARQHDEAGEVPRSPASRQGSRQTPSRAPHEQEGA